jgi:hypothetical protein
MPVAMTYTSLQEDIRRYIERGNVSDTTVYEQIPSLINLAERDIARKLKIQGFINVVTSTLVAGVSVYAKPDRWRRTVSMEFGVAATPAAATQNKRIPIFARDYEYSRNYWPDSTATAQPEYYADYDYQHWLVVPTPDINYPWQIMYYEQPPYLDVTTQTNWLTEYAPQALLYGALVQAEPFLKNDERIPVWQGMYGSAVNDLNVEDLKKILDRNVTRQEA